MSESSAYSNLKIFHHIDKLDALINGRRSAPLYIRIKPTNVCNMKCFYCSYSDLDVATNKEANFNDSIEWNVMERFINSIGKMGVKAVTYSGGGDPLCYKYFKETALLTLENNIDLSIITNGLLMREEERSVLKNAKWVRISMDAVKPETYAKIRNVPVNCLSIIFGNISELRKLTDETEIGINYVIHDLNYNEIYEAAKTAKELGCNHIKFAARILTEGLLEYHKPFFDIACKQLRKATNELESSSFRVINKYESDFSTDTKNKRDYRRCAIKEIHCVVAADGCVYFCQDKAYKPDSVIGSIAEQPFDELWFSDDTTKLFKSFDASAECSGHCVHDSRNILLNSIIDLDSKHINFI